MSIESAKDAPAYIYAHYGGAVAYRARDMNSQMAVTAFNLSCVVISVDYRKGPEVKCPMGSQDFCDAFEYIVENPENFGISVSKVVLAGTCGGGWIVAGAANLMVRSGQI